MLRFFSKSLGLLLLSGLGLLPSTAEPKNDLLEILTIDHLRATFPTLGIDQLSKPGRRWSGIDHTEAPDSWLDGLARLKLTPQLEEEIVTLIRNSPGFYHQTYRAVVPPSEMLWLEARFHEIRSRSDQALALYRAAGPDTLDYREKIAFGRLLFLSGDEKASREAFQQVTDWAEFKAEFHVFTITGQSDRLPEFFKFLRQIVAPTAYRKDIYPRELDYAFAHGQWQGALTQAEEDSPLWHLFALNYYGENKMYDELRTTLLNSINPISLDELLLYSLDENAEELIARLLAGDGTPAGRRKLIHQLVASNLPKEIWLSSWIQKFPDEVRTLSLELTLRPGRNSLTLNSRQLETSFSLFLEQEPWDLTQPTTLARLAMIHRYRGSQPLLDYLATVACHDLPMTLPDLITNDPDLIRELQGNDPLALILLPARNAMPRQPILEALQANPSFKALSKAGQARYLLLAKLHRPLLATLMKVDWSKETNTPLARAASRSLDSKQWTKPDKFTKARWLNQYISDKNKTFLPGHLEWWAWQLEELNLRESDLEMIVEEATKKIAAKLELGVKETRDTIVASIHGSLAVPTAIALIQGDTNSPEEHLLYKLERDQFLGHFVLNAAAIPPLINARAENYQGPWTGNRTTPYAVTTNYYRTLRHLNWIEIKSSRHLADIGRENWPTLAKNIRRHLNLPARQEKETFINDWIQYRLAHGKEKSDFHPFLLQWPGQGHPGTILGKALVSPAGQQSSAKTNTLLDAYPTSFFRGLTASYRQLRHQKPTPVITGIKRRITASNSDQKRAARSSIPRRVQEQKNNDISEVRKFFLARILDGKSLAELEKSLQRFREFSSLDDFDNLLKHLGNEASRSDPDWEWDDWYEEVMSYLESIPPYELWEAGSGHQLPMSERLATHPKFAKRYFNWVKEAGGGEFKKWISLAGLIFESEDPATVQLGYQWLEKAVTGHPNDLLMQSQYSTHLRQASSSSPDNLWTKLGKSGKLTPFADHILPHFNRNIDAKFTLLLLAASNKPEAKSELMERIRTLKRETGVHWRSDSHLNPLRWTLKTFPEGLEKYARLQKDILDDPELSSGTDLVSLLQTPQEIPANEAISRTWDATTNTRNFYRDARILGIALNEAEDETFQVILKEFAAHKDALAYVTLWQDILQDHHLSDPARLKQMLDHLLKEGRLAKLRDRRYQRGYSWNDVVPEILHAVNRCNHRELLAALDREWTGYLNRKPTENHYLSKSDTERFLLFAENPPPPRPILSLAKSADRKPLVVWSLLGGTDDSDMIFESSIKPYEGHFDLTLFQRPKEGPPIALASSENAPTQGHFIIPPEKLTEGSRFFLRATPAGQPEKGPRDSPNIVIAPDFPSKVSLENRWNFAKTSEKGPFGVRDVWRGRFIGEESAARAIELKQWKRQATPNLNLSFWLNRGSRENIQVTINALDQKGEILKKIVLKSATGGHIARGGWQEVVFHQTDHQIPEGTSDLSLRITRNGTAFYLTRPEFSID